MNIFLSLDLRSIAATVILVLIIFLIKLATVLARSADRVLRQGMLPIAIQGGGDRGDLRGFRQPASASDRHKISINIYKLLPMADNNLKYETVMDDLRSILVGLGIPEDAIDERTAIHANLGLDSVETVKLALELKRRLGLDLKLGTRQDFTLAQICQMAIA